MADMTQALAEDLRAGRSSAGLSLQAVADRSNVSTAYLHKLEGGGVRTPSPHVLHRIGGVLGIPYPRLMASAGYVPTDPEVPPMPAPATNAHLAQMLQEVIDELAELRRRQDELVAEVRRLAGGRPPGS
jgi:transcriptional regulator with XRE-family HTH domain